MLLIKSTLNVLLAGSLLALVGCASSPTPNFYTLSTAGGLPVTSAPGSVPSYRVVVGPVALPDAVDRPQLVIRTSAQRVEIKEDQRWAGALQSEIAQTLSAYLGHALPKAMVYSQVNSTAGQVPANYRIAIDIQRFDSLLDSLTDQGSGLNADGVVPRGSLLGLSWVLSEIRTDGQPGLRWLCQTHVQSTASGSGYEGLVSAHQDSLAKVALAMTQLLTAVTTVQPPALPAGTSCQQQSQ